MFATRWRLNVLLGFNKNSRVRIVHGEPLDFQMFLMEARKSVYEFCGGRNECIMLYFKGSLKFTDNKLYAELVISMSAMVTLTLN